MFPNLISASYANVDSTFPNERGYICCWEEDESYWEVLYEGNVKSVVAVELDI